jgi:hypothetical protein
MGVVLVFSLAGELYVTRVVRTAIAVSSRVQAALYMSGKPVELPMTLLRFGAPALIMNVQIIANKKNVI